MRVSAIENLLVHCFSDEAIILDLNNETYYSFNETGTVMWHALTTCDSIDTACDLLATRFNVPRETLQVDLQDFIAQLKALELVVVYE